MFISDWWNSLSTVAQVFACIAIPSTLLLIIQTILMFIGFENDSDGLGDGAPDLGDATPDDLPEASDGIFGSEDLPEIHDASGLEGLRIFTARGIVAFLVVFGWVGLVMDGANVRLFITLPVAFACGFLMMVALAFLFRAILRLRSDGNTDNRNAVGTAGKVQLTIPPARTGEGKVHLMLQGSYVERNAVTDEDTAIPTGAEIIVIGVSGQTDLIVKRK